MEFVISCKENKCSQGFFAFYKISGFCDTSVDVQENDSIYEFTNDSLSYLSTDPKLDGIYSLKFKVSPIVRIDDLKYSRCIDINEQKSVYLKCKPIDFNKIDLPTETALTDVMKIYADRSKNEKLVQSIINWLLPLLLALAILIPFKFNSKLARRLSLASVVIIVILGFPHVMYGRQLWALTGLVGLVYCLSKIMIALYRLIFKKKIKTT